VETVDHIAYSTLLSGLVHHQGIEDAFLVANEAMAHGVPCTSRLWSPILFKMLEDDLEAAFLLLQDLTTNRRMRVDHKLRKRIESACRRQHAPHQRWLELPSVRPPSTTVPDPEALLPLQPIDKP
jgi:hypothetical protein